MPNNAKKVELFPISLRLSPELLQRVDEVHKQYGPIGPYTRTDIIRIAIEEGLSLVHTNIKRRLQQVLAAEVKRRKGGFK